MKGFIFGLVLTMAIPLALKATDLPDDQFQFEILNRTLIISVMKNGQQYFQQGVLVNVEDKKTTEAGKGEASCRFDWAADGGEDVQIPAVLTAVLKVENVGRMAKANVFQVGFGFKEAPVVLSCNKISEIPIKFEDIEGSLKGIVKLIPPPVMQPNTQVVAMHGIPHF